MCPLHFPAAMAVAELLPAVTAARPSSGAGHDPSAPHPPPEAGPVWQSAQLDGWDEAAVQWGMMLGNGMGEWGQGDPRILGQ